MGKHPLDTVEDPLIVLAPPELVEKYSSKTKDTEEFRNYETSAAQARVENHYKNMRTYQTMAFLEKMEKKYYKFDKEELTIMEAFERLQDYVDASDPDSELANLIHMMQTAEAIRKAGHPDWMVLTGLLHDMGKIMFLWGTEEDGQVGTASGQQWALGGDTWVVGAPIPEKGIVFPQFSHLNPDMKDARYNSGLGMYKEKEGIMNLNFAFGHDEYMYRLLVHNKTTLPLPALQMIRLHSCYPWHTGENYRELMAEGDEEIEKWVILFNSFDLYTKSDDKPDVEALKPYYQSLIDKYIPGKLKW